MSMPHAENAQLRFYTDLAPLVAGQLLQQEPHDTHGKREDREQCHRLDQLPGRDHASFAEPSAGAPAARGGAQQGQEMNTLQSCADAAPPSAPAAIASDNVPISFFILLTSLASFLCPGPRCGAAGTRPALWTAGPRKSQCLSLPFHALTRTDRGS